MRPGMSRIAPTLAMVLSIGASPFFLVAPLATGSDAAPEESPPLTSSELLRMLRPSASGLAETVGLRDRGEEPAALFPLDAPSVELDPGGRRAETAGGDWPHLRILAGEDPAPELWVV